MTAVTEARPESGPAADRRRARELRRGGWRLMADSLRPSKGWIAVGVVSSLGWTLTKIIVPLLAKQAVDDAMDPFRARRMLHFLLEILAITVVIAITAAARRYAAYALSLKAETDLRHRMFAHFQRLHFGFHDRSQTGELMARATTDLRQIQLLLVFLPVSGANIVMIAGVTAILFAMSAKLALVSLAALPLLNIAATRFSHRIHPEYLNLQQRLADVSGVVEESVAGIRVVKGFGAEELQSERLDAAADAVYDRGLRLARLRANFTPMLELLPTVGLIAVLYVGGREVINGHLTLGALIAFDFYILQLIFPIRMTAQIIASASRGSASAARVYEVLSTDPDIVDRPGAIALPPGDGSVRFDHVTFGYTPDAPVLTDVDITIRAGEAVALVGRTGSGKSTIARLLPRFYEPSSGTITIDGADISTVRLDDIRRAVSIVFEDTFLFTDTIRSNIAFADPTAGQEAIERAACLSGAHEFISELPDGYDTVLGEGGLSLSGGQRQRIAIARAILADPRVLILDDATSAVDPTKEHEIRAALEEVTHGRTTIIIGHRPATIALADRVILIDHGQVVDQGTHDELCQRSALYRAVLAQGDHEQQDEEVPA
jgi:ATP-binding cassette subfamily B protein